MNRSRVDPIADAVLYEGYILYPYRPSVKNRQRWTFGGLYPEAHCRAQRGSDAPANQTECLVRGTPETTVEAVVRFLHLTVRQVGAIDPPLADWPEGGGPPFLAVEALRVGEKRYSTWQEAEEREVVLAEMSLGELTGVPRRVPFSFAGGRRSEPVRGEAGEVVGLLTREQQAVAGDVEVSAVEAGDGLFRLTVRVSNRAPLGEECGGGRDAALLRALVATHEILGVRGGAFVSLMDPPDDCRDLARACRNAGTWPVLIGAEGEGDLMLSSPIILYDDPQLAPESPAAFFDGTEIDEMLTLRVLTMTDEEKREMAAVDERASALLAKVNGLTDDDLSALHGTVRALRPVAGEDSRG